MQGMGRRLVELKPLELDSFSSAQDGVFKARFEELWESVRALPGSELRLLAESIYFHILDLYMSTQRVITLQSIARLYDAQWRRVLKAAGQEPAKIGDLLHCLRISGTLPIEIQMTDRGGMLILPMIVRQVITSRIIAGQAGVPDFDLVFAGAIQGPMPNERGVHQAYNALWPEPESAEKGHSEQKIDTAPQPAVFPTVTPAQYPGDTTTD